MIYHNCRVVKCNQKGFVLIELLVAMVILVTAFSAVTLVSFGTQSFLTDSENSANAQIKVKSLLAEARSLAISDFDTINSTSSTEIDRVLRYDKQIFVEIGSSSSIKKITASIFWNPNLERRLNVSMVFYVTDFNNTKADNTCDSNLLGDWSNPKITTFNLADIAGNSGSEFTIGGIDAYRGMLYVTAKNTGTKTDPTLFIFDVKNPDNPIFQSKIDDSPTTISGLGDIDVAMDNVTGKTYAYIASVRSVSGSATFGQLQIFDVSNPLLPFLDTFLKISDAVSLNTSQAVGNSISYKDGYVYLGLTKTGGGPEFNIVDVHDHSQELTMLSRVGMFNVGSTVNALKIKNSFAYLATTDNQELKVLDVSNTNNPWLIFGGGYDAPDSVGSGKSLALIGDTLYLGRTFTATHPEFYILDNSDPTNLQGNNTAPFSQEIGSSVAGLIIRDYLVFILTTTTGQFQIWDISNPSGIKRFASSIYLPDGGVGSAIDCEGNYIFVGSNDAGGKGSISIITSIL